MQNDRLARIVAPVGEINHYCNELAACHAPSTVQLRRTQLRSLQTFAGDLMTVDRATVAAWIAASTAPATRASKHDAATSYFGWLHTIGLRDDNPTDGIPRQRVLPRTPRLIDDDTVTRALATAKPTAARAIILARFAGLRAAEIATLHRTDYTPGHLRIRGKGDRIRIIPVGPIIAEVATTSDGFIFPGRTAGHVQPRTITMMVSAALPDPFTCHDLRHAYATEFYTHSGHDLMWTAEVLGHSSIDTTRRYIHQHRDDEHTVAATIGTGVDLPDTYAEAG